MDSSNDRRGAQGGSLLSLAPASGPREEAGSLLPFPGLVRGDSPAERHARARTRRESRPSDLLEALGRSEPPKPEPSGPELHEVAAEPVIIVEAVKPVSEQSLVGKLLGRRRAAKGETVAEPAAATKAAAKEQAKEPDESAIDRVEAMLRQQQIEMARLASNVSAVPPAPKEDRLFDDPAGNGGEDGGAAEVHAYEPSPRQADDDSWKPFIDPVRVVRGVTDSRNLIIALTLLGASLGVLTALATPKKYEATAEIVIDPRDLKIGDRPLTDANGLPSDSTIALVENQVRVLSSGTVLNKVAEQLNLESDPEFNGTGGGLDLNPINFIRGLLTRSDGTADPGRLRAVTVSNLGEHVWVERTGRSFVVLVNATSDDPETSAKIANKMVEVFIQTSGSMQSDSAGRANAEVVAQLDRLRKEVEAAEQKVEKFRADNDLVGAQGRLMTDEEILKLNDQLGAARARTLELNARAESARQMSVDAVVGGAIPEVAASGTMAELRAQYSAAKQEADRVSVRLGPRHPSYQSAQAQVAAVTSQISNELKRISAQLQNELKRSVQTEQEFAARLAQLKVRQGDVSNEMVALRELERDAQARRSVYEAYLLRANETSEQTKINSSNVSIISLASAPIRSSGTSRAVIAGTGAMLGLLAGLGLGVLRGLAGGFSDAMRDKGAGDVPRRVPPRRPLAGGGAARKREAEDEPPVTTIAKPEDESVNQYYPPHGYAPYPQQPAAPQPAYPQPHPYAAPVAYPQPQPVPAYPPQPVGYPYPPQAYAPQVWPQPWPPAPPVAAPMPHPVYAQPMMPPVQQPYAQPQPVQAYAPQYAAPVQPAPEPAADSLSQISESVREFRDAVRELAETRLRRRYF